MANEKRLIDANAIKYRTICCGGWGQPEVVADKYNIDKMPTVDFVVVVHAEWLDGSAIQNGKEVYKSIDCSHCEEVFKIESETREYWKARFKVCPFCGAVMDGGNEDG